MWRGAIKGHLLDSAAVTRQTAEACVPDIEKAARMIAECLGKGGRLLLCGNGGSAAECQHIAAEFTSVLSREFLRPALSAVALTTDTSFLTASANDFGFEGVFARQVEAIGRKGDVLVAISTSGNSPNILRAVGRARELGISTIGLTGTEGGGLAECADVQVRVPSADVQHVQETHAVIGHVLCLVVERILFEDGANAKGLVEPSQA
jgi:D-sedoheptulose 7-phosphate isomerase